MGNTNEIKICLHGINKQTHFDPSMSSQSTSYYSRSMNGVVELTDGVTEISDGSIVCDKLTCDTFVTNSFNANVLSDGVCYISSGNMTNIDTLNAGSINCSQVNCSSFLADSFGALNLQAQDLNLSSTLNFKNSGTLLATTSIANNYLRDRLNSTGIQGNLWSSVFNTSRMVLDATGKLFLGGDLKSVNPSTTQNVFASNVSSVVLGGSGGVAIGKTTAYPNSYMEMTTTGYNSILDFHCSTVKTNYDSRIVSTAGGTTDGKAILGFITGVFDVSANINTNLYTPKVD